MGKVPAHVVTQRDQVRLMGVDGRVLDLLMDGEEHARLELLEASGFAALPSSISRLRKAGHKIVCRRGEAPGVTYYRLVLTQLGEGWNLSDRELDELVNGGVGS